MNSDAPFSHLNKDGEASMVDVADRSVTTRVARATGRVNLTSEIIAALRDKVVPKGDVFGVARVAAIMAAKKTSELIPMCHPLAIHGVDVELSLTDNGVDVAVEVKTVDRTGVEMEALIAVTVACLTIIDMTKSIDASSVISDVKITSKSGGRNGEWKRGS